MDACNTSEGRKSLDLHCFEWILRRAVLAPGKAQMEDLVLGFSLWSATRSENVSPEKIGTFERFLLNGGIRNGDKLLCQFCS